MQKQLLIPLVIMTLSACQTSNTSSTSTQPATADRQDVTSTPTQIIFLDMEISRDTLTKESTVKLLNKMVTDGRMKNLAHPDQQPGPGDLQCSFLSGAEQVLYTTPLPDPLANTLEYAAQTGELHTKTFHLPKATFSLRAPYYPGSTYLRIEQIQPDNQRKEIARLPL